MPNAVSCRLLTPTAIRFLETTSWGDARCETTLGDASTRQYFRLRKENTTAILMDASRNIESVAPFIQLDKHLETLGFSVPGILAADTANGFLLLEDFGDDTFTRLLERTAEPEQLYTLATDVLIALHKSPVAIPKSLRAYHAAKMLEDLEPFLEWCTPAKDEAAKAAFRRVWSEVLPVAHQVPVSLLLRDYHVANLMLLTEREGIRRAGLLDFQDAYQGPVTYDLMSLLEDARRTVATELQERLIAYYLEHFPALEPKSFAASMAILAALRHTRVLAIFERLSRREGKHEYKKLHSPRVERMLDKALMHPMLASVKQWFERYAR